MVNLGRSAMRKILHGKKRKKVEEPIYRVQQKYFGKNPKEIAFRIQQEILRDPEKSAFVIAAEYGIPEHRHIVELYRQIFLGEEAKKKPEGRSLIV